jgi:uncharacterized metal-binding protein YceD (DUF177 family)
MSDFPKLDAFRAVVRVEALDREPHRVTLTAAADDRARIADYLGIPGIEALSGEAAATRRGPLVEVEGQLRAELVRQCVVSLEEMAETVDEPFVMTFTTEPEEIAPGEEVEADLDAPDPIEGDELDLGAVLVEQLVLSMSAHPRKEGAEPATDPGAGATISPFAALEKLKSQD